MSSTVSSPIPATPVLMTAAEFIQRHGGERVELVKGCVKELPMPSPKHGKICATITRLLGNHAAESGSGHTMSNNSFVLTRSDPDTVRGADVCFYSYERLPKGEVPEGILPVVPDLVVEVRSSTDRWGEIFVKVGEYLQAGVRVVIVLDPVTTTASVFREDGMQETLQKSEDLTVPEVLPGFSVSVSRLFE